MVSQKERTHTRENEPEPKGNYEQLLEDLNNQYLNRDIPRPEEWGGYLVIPDTIEF